ncbi:HNH endonuclease [Acidovorax sp. M2(2025)]|uniref:HNH endonuclease n=1 Tax=Acidovorax sp. M2(2025) TaxID=3411355 RepID=UPI003BF50C71
MTFEEWMRSRNWTESTIRKYDGAMRGALTEWAIEAGLSDGPLTSIFDVGSFREISSRLVQLPVFLARNKRGHSMYGAALRRYINFLEESVSDGAGGHAGADDLSRNPSDEERTVGRIEEAVIEEGREYPEGAQSYRLHRHIERSGALPGQAKARRLVQTGRLDCDVCGFNFSAAYGELGADYIEAHHTVPVSSMAGQAITRIEDVALVCANCHRMLHRGDHLLTVQELRSIINAHRASEQASPSSPPCA